MKVIFAQYINQYNVTIAQEGKPCNVEIVQNVDSYNVDILQEVVVFKTTIASLGEQGIPGKSAYEIAVIDGFVGTEQEWLKSLEANLKNEEYDYDLLSYYQISKL